MLLHKKYKPFKLLAFSGVSLFALYSLMGFSSSGSTDSSSKSPHKSIIQDRTEISKTLGKELRQNNFPEKVETEGFGSRKVVNFEYTLNENMQKEAVKLLRSYRPDYGAIFMMDAVTGEVLTMASFQRDNPEAENLNLMATFPAASIFKVVTATAAVDKAGVTPNHKIKYNGGAYTLYKKNVLSDKVTRWTNVITLRDAFARSINTAFGRLSIENLHPEDLHDYAQRFFFNQEISTDFPVDMGVAYIPPGKGFEMAEAASGFTRSNRMSPVQGAMIAASIANDGQMVIPYLVQKATDKNGDVIYEGRTLENGSIMTAESANHLRDLMSQTVTAGTSRRSFRPIVNDKKYREIEMGGKTGHLTGDNPRGRVDWFVGFAQDSDRKIAIAAITVNKKFWTVKSSYLGQSMFKKYFAPHKPTKSSVAAASK
ncbi:penicillin-binding protein transpeptidase domain-containing protein [Bdellovibrio bacteriovorus W]|nr:penicillin-binding protein transpeptidase domain-containing protein [Bdellovibrio bacteriovorus W]